MNAAQLEHPPGALLTAYGLGQLSEEDLAEVDEHLAGCAVCRQVVEGVGPDTLLNLLRSAATEPDNTEWVAGAESRGVSAGLAESGCTAPAAAVPSALTIHARYRVGALLGIGGMGAVYKAEHLFMERPVALKVLNRELIDKPATVERFRREVRAAARLTHPNIVAAFDAEQAGDAHFLVMEFVEGVSLARRIADHGPLPVAQACDYARQAALGLQHAHERGMVHRDIKPQNLMLTPSGQVKILDFGLARFVMESVLAGAMLEAEGGAADPGSAESQATHLTQTGIVMGTPDYIAPEQARDSHLADIRADIYSLGCTLYHLLAGHAPFPEDAAVEKVQAHLGRAPTPLSDFRHDVPPELVNVIDRMMAKDPAQRFQTPAEVAAALMPFVSAPPQESGTRSQQPGVRNQSARTTPSKRSHGWTWIAIGGAMLPILAVLALGIVLYWPTPDGIIRIESDDPGVEVVFDKDGAIVKGVDKQPIRLMPGKHAVLVRRGDFEFGTDKLVLKRGETITLKVEVLKGKMQLVQDGKVLAACDLPQARLKGDTIAIVRKFQGHTDEVWSVALSGDGRHVLTGSGDKTAILWEAATGKKLQTFLGHINTIDCVDLSGDGKHVLTGSEDTTAILWDAATGKKLQTFLGHTLALNAVALSSDGKHVLTGSEDKTAILWDVATGKKIRTFLGHSASVRGVVLSRDGRHVLTGSQDNTAILWETASGKKLKTFKDANWITSVALSGDGKHILTGSSNKTAILWDAATARKLQTFSGHPTSIPSVGLSSDGKLVLTGSHDGTAILWVASSGKRIQTFQGHTDKIRSVALSADSKHVLTGSADRTAILWKVNPVEKGVSLAPKFINSLGMEFTNSLGMEFVPVPKGKAWLGGDRRGPGEREVEIARDFYLGKYEVTQEEWEKVTGSNPSEFKAVPGVSTEDQKRFPVENVSWNDVQLFLKLLNAQAKDTGWEYRLPKEAEWEYACRGGPMTDKADSAFDFYLDKPTNQFLPAQANMGQRLFRTCKVGSYKPNSLGLYDMHGNVAEWCADVIIPENPKHPRGPSLRANRGGAWYSGREPCLARVCDKHGPSTRLPYLGLRVARVPVGAAVK